jgi:hypothetical protein
MLIERSQQRVYRRVPTSDASALVSREREIAAAVSDSPVFGVGVLSHPASPTHTENKTNKIRIQRKWLFFIRQNL